MFHINKLGWAEMAIEKYTSDEFMTTDDFPFWIERVRHNSLNVPAAHSHEFIELVYVVDGNAKHVFEGKSYPIKTNDVFIINPGEVHTFNIKPNEQIEIINCLFLPTLIQDSLLEELGISQSMDFFYIHPFLDDSERFHHFINLNGSYPTLIITLLEGMIDEINKEKSSFTTLIRMRLIELLLILSRIYNEITSMDDYAKSNHSILVKRISGYLARNFNQKISIPDLANLFNVSSRHLSRIFKQETGKTVLEYVHYTRIERAKALLLRNDTKIIEVALSVGYDDPAFFSRLFKRIVGFSPGEYKKRESLRFSKNNKIKGIYLENPYRDNC